MRGDISDAGVDESYLRFTMSQWGLSNSTTLSIEHERSGNVDREFALNECPTLSLEGSKFDADLLRCLPSLTNEFL